MKWRTNEEQPADRELCFCEVTTELSRCGRPYVLRFIAEDDDIGQYWSGPGLMFDTDDVTRWCPVKEIMALLNSENDADNAGGSSDG